MPSPTRQALTFSGNGGLSMLMGDLISLRQHRIPIKIVVFNNGVLGFVALEMKAAGWGHRRGSRQPGFRAVARAVELHDVRVEHPADLPGTIDDVRAHDGPALLDVVTTKQELVLPPTIGLEQVKGFSLWGLRAVMDGRMHEAIDLAKINLSAH